MKRFKRILGILLIMIGPLLIFTIADMAFGKVDNSMGLQASLPWLLLATVVIPVGMALSVVGFLFVKGELDN